MADKLGLSNEIKEIKLGKSFMKGDHPCFHTFRYDFMPASLDTSKRATIDIGEGHQVTVTVPHIEGSGTANTVFKGSKKPYQKECVLIIDHNTGEITLEKLSYNVQLKKTRAEGSSKIRSNTPIDPSFMSKKSPSTVKASPQQRPHTSSLGRSSPVQKCSPLPKSPSGSQPSPHSMPSLSMLGSKPVPEVANPAETDIGVLSSSSSDSSSSEESSDSSSDNEEEAKSKTSSSTLSMPVSNSFNWKEASINMPSASINMPSASINMPSVPINMPSVPINMPSVPINMPSVPIHMPSVPINMPSVPVNMPSVPINMPSVSINMPSASSSSINMPSVNSLPSMPKFSLLSEDLKLSESDSDSDD